MTPSGMRGLLNGPRIDRRESAVQVWIPSGGDVRVTIEKTAPSRPDAQSRPLVIWASARRFRCQRGGAICEAGYGLPGHIRDTHFRLIR